VPIVACKRPPLIVVEPVYVLPLAPLSVSVEPPVFANEPEPLIAPENVMLSPVAFSSSAELSVMLRAVKSPFVTSCRTSLPPDIVVPPL